LIVGLLLPGAWSIHNSLSTRHATFTSQTGYALLIPASGALAMADHISMSEATVRLENEIHTANPTLLKGSVQESDAYKREAIEVMKQYPVPTLAYHVAGIIRILGGTGLDMLVELVSPQGADAYNASTLKTTFTGSGTLSLLKRFPALIPLQVLYMLFLLLIYIFFVLGCYRGFRDGRADKALVLLLPFLAIVAVSCHQGYFRFRIPLMPFIAFGAGWFFQSRTKHS
jgi:hypothetical protein